MSGPIFGSVHCLCGNGNLALSASCRCSVFLRPIYRQDVFTSRTALHLWSCHWTSLAYWPYLRKSVSASIPSLPGPLQLSLPAYLPDAQWPSVRCGFVHLCLRHAIRFRIGSTSRTLRLGMLVGPITACPWLKAPSLDGAYLRNWPSATALHHVTGGA